MIIWNIILALFWSYFATTKDDASPLNFITGLANSSGWPKRILKNTGQQEWYTLCKQVTLSWIVFQILLE